MTICQHFMFARAGVIYKIIVRFRCLWYIEGAEKEALTGFYLHPPPLVFQHRGGFCY